jgi:hypothetical protein
MWEAKIGGLRSEAGLGKNMRSSLKITTARKGLRAWLK